jgi:hypothetical protein
VCASPGAGGRTIGTAIGVWSQLSAAASDGHSFEHQQIT